MKNKNKLFIIIGVLITIAFLLIIDVMFPIKKSKTVKVLLENDSKLVDSFENLETEIIADSEKDNYIREERDKKTAEELNEEEKQKVKEESEYKIKTYNVTKFKYNINDKEIEIVGYNGMEKNLIIPTKIDGYDVNKINLNKFDNNIESVFIPNSIEEIEGKIESDNYDKTNFIIVNVVVIISMIIFIVAICTLSNKNLEENFYNSTSYIFSFLYLIVALIFCYSYRSLGMLYSSFIVKYGILLIVYIILMISLRFYKNKLMSNDG